MTIYYPTEANFIQKTLNAQLLAGATTSATLNNVTSIQNKAGIMIVDRVDANGVETPNKVEVVSFAGTSGSTVTTLVRALGGTTDQDHEVGAIVEFGPDIVWAQGLIDTMLVQHNEDGTHKSALVTTLKATGAEITTGTEDAKIVTPKAIADSDIPTAKATAAEVVTGTDDTKYTTALAVAPYANYSMARQALINGNFDVWQRGTSFTSLGGVLTADRWKFYIDSAVGSTVSQVAAGLNGSQYAWKYQKTAGDADNGTGYLTQALESRDSIKFRGKKLTFSFWAKAGANCSLTSSTLNATIESGTGTDQAVGGMTNEASIATGSIVLTTSWQKCTITTSNVVADTVNQLAVQIYGATSGTAGADDSFYIAQVQLCAGDVALPFQPKSYEQEKHDCMRYCYWIGGDDAAQVFATGWNLTTTRGAYTIHLPTEMRTNPTPTYAGTVAIRHNNSLVNITALGTYAGSKNTMTVYADVASGLTAGQGSALAANSDANARIKLECEL